MWLSVVVLEKERDVKENEVRIMDQWTAQQIDNCYYIYNARIVSCKCTNNEDSWLKQRYRNQNEERRKRLSLWSAMFQLACANGVESSAVDQDVLEQSNEWSIIQDRHRWNRYDSDSDHTRNIWYGLKMKECWMVEWRRLDGEINAIYHGMHTRRQE